MSSANPATAAVSVVVLCASFIHPFESGNRQHLEAYKDPVGIWTICDGETQGVHKGMKLTAEQCRELMLRRIPDYLGPVNRLMPGLPVNRQVAYTDFAWNEGIGMLTIRTRKVKGTSVVDLERAGRWQSACNRLLKFNTAQHVVLKGLDTRRKAENKVCLYGLPAIY